MGLRIRGRARNDRGRGILAGGDGRRIRLSVGEPLRDLRIERIGRFSYGAMLADRFREGRAFLAGDAAHQVTPRGGTGMNTAIRDGRDLGWKLAWRLHGWAGDELLDSYEPERRPVARAQHGALGGPQRLDSKRRGGAARRHRSSHPARLGRTGRSTLDLLGEGFTLLSGPDADWRPAAPQAPLPTPPRRDHGPRDRAGHARRHARAPGRSRGRGLVDWPASAERPAEPARA